jgi:hypothetical protein
LQLDSPLEQQERYIAYGSGVYFVIMIWLIYLEWTEGTLQDLSGPFTAVIGGLPDILTVASLTAISFAIGYFIKYLGLHKWVDEIFFKFRKETDNYIVGCIGAKYEELKPTCKYRLPLRYELMDIFYEFVDIQTDSWAIQRALYFSYYTKYGLSINLFALSMVGLGVILVIYLLRRDIGIVGNSALLFFVVIGLVALVLSQHKIRPEVLQYVTRPQIYRIVYDEHFRLRKMLRKRFRFYKPEYRYYETGYKSGENHKVFYRAEYNEIENKKNRVNYNVPKKKIYFISMGVLIGLAVTIIIFAIYNMYSSYLDAEKNKCQASDPTQWCIGTNADDDRIGTINSDFMTGMTGNDHMEGHAKNDTMSGNSGSDDISAGDGDDYVDGGSGDDNIVGDDGNDRIYGGTGADEIEGGLGVDVIYQNNEANEPDGEADVINCGLGNDHAFILPSEGDIAAVDCENKYSRID